MSDDARGFLIAIAIVVSLMFAIGVVNWLVGGPAQ